MSEGHGLSMMRCQLVAHSYVEQGWKRIGQGVGVMIGILPQTVSQFASSC
jgi:hypothetical protein